MASLHSIRILVPLLAVLWLLPAAPAAALDPWEPLPTCLFGMPLMPKIIKKDQRGTINAVLKAVFEKERIRFRHLTMPYERALDEVGQGNIQCTLNVGGKSGTLLPGATPVYFCNLSAARLKTTPWKGEKSLKGKRVAYPQGLGMEKLLNVNILPQHVYDLSTAFHLLEQGLAQYALEDRALLKEAMRDSKLPSHLFAIDPIRIFGVYPVFAPTEEGRRYRKIYNRRMQELAVSGELAAILAKNGLGKGCIERILKAQ
jgi:hypothetical protein